MSLDVFRDFNMESNVSESVVNEYKQKLPEELIQVWEEYGFGTICNGYIKIINPSIYEELLKKTYFRGNISIPIMVTGFGDIITWEKNRYVGIVKYRKGSANIILGSFKHFFRCLSDECFLEEDLDWNLYLDAIGSLDKLKFDECFGYVPLLGLGGSEKVENLKKVKIREHIELITQLVGPIG